MGESFFDGHLRCKKLYFGCTAPPSKTAFSQKLYFQNVVPFREPILSPESLENNSISATYPVHIQKKSESRMKHLHYIFNTRFRKSQFPSNWREFFFESIIHVPLKRHVFRLCELYYVCKVKGTKETQSQRKSGRPPHETRRGRNNE